MSSLTICSMCFNYDKETMMNFAPLYNLLNNNAAPKHAKTVILGLMLCDGTCQVTPEHFATDPDLKALAGLKLVALHAKGLVVAKKAYQLVGIDPPSTAVEIA